MADSTTYAPSPLPGAPPPPTYAPTALPGAAPAATTGFQQPTPAPAPAPAASPYKPSVLDLIAHHETGDRNIVQSLGTRDINNNYGRGGGDPAKGNFQMIDTTYRPAAIKAGIDVNKYPQANMLPPSEQARVATYIPLNQWGPSTKALIRQYYPNIDMSRPPSGTYHGGNIAAGSVAATAGGAPATTPAAVPPPPVGVGGLLGALNAPGASGKSTMDNLGSEFSGEKQQPPANLPDNLQAAAGGGFRATHPPAAD